MSSEHFHILSLLGCEINMFTMNPITVSLNAYFTVIYCSQWNHCPPVIQGANCLWDLEKNTLPFEIPVWSWWLLILPLTFKFVVFSASHFHMQLVPNSYLFPFLSFLVIFMLLSSTLIPTAFVQAFIISDLGIILGCLILSNHWGQKLTGKYYCPHHYRWGYIFLQSHSR